jgi:hypothetical protein
VAVDGFPLFYPRRLSKRPTDCGADPRGGAIGTKVLEGRLPGGWKTRRSRSTAATGG